MTMKPTANSTSTPRGKGGARTQPRFTSPLQNSMENTQDTSEESCQPRNEQTNIPNCDSGRCQSRDPSPQPHSNGPPSLKEIALSPMIKEAFECIYGKGTEDYSQAVRYFTTATEEPPITKKSLTELDISSIINNSKLRHDVNFDRELHFRPNMEGPKGQAKRRVHEEYWQAVTVEFNLYQWMIENSAPQDVVSECQKRVPAMFDTIKAILKNLVPERDQPAVEQHLDRYMVMQEIERGVCDFVNIAAWLAKLLKRHCAPMRDEMVDRMVEKVQNGSSAGISKGLCELFGVLEAMKLDVANHQIRHLKALLIEDTINFEQKYHVSRMSRHRYDVHSARAWYLKGKDMLDRIPLTKSWPNRDVECFVSVLFQYLLPDSPRSISPALPDTFNLDIERLRTLKVDLDALIRENICCDLLEQMVQLRKKRKLCSATAISAFRKDFQVIISEGKNPIKWDIDSIAVELTRHALRESGSSTTIDHALTKFAERKLREAFSSPEFRREFATSHKSSLCKDIFASVEGLLTSSPVDIFNTLVAPTMQGGATPPPPTKPVRRHDVLQRITHIAVLHWRIWENIVYNNDELPFSPPPSTIMRTPSPPQIIHTMPRLPPSTESPATKCQTTSGTTEATTEADSKENSTILKSG